MYYEINVSLNGSHFFATHERSITNTWELQKVLKMFKEKFPSEEGFKIMVTEQIKYGKPLDIAEVLAEK